MKKALIVAGVVVLLAASFWGGTFYSDSKNGSSGRGTAMGTPPDGFGGPMGNLTEQEQAQIQDMTDAERQQFFQEKMGSADPRGAAGGPGGMGGRMGGALEGEVIEVAEDTITIKTANGSSQTVYTDDDTVIGYAQGAAQIAAGSSVMVMASPEADGVMTATGILVK